MAHIFISYSKKDIEFTRHLKRSLEESGFVVWMDETAVRPSARWWPTIERNIETSAAVVVVMSPSSRESDWVEREILYAERLDKPIFPVLYEGEDWPRLANIQYTDMTAGTRNKLPVELEDSLNGVVVPSKIGAVTLPPDLPGERIPEAAAGAATPRQPRSVLPWSIVLLIVAGAALAGGLMLGGALNRDEDTPTPTLERIAEASATPQPTHTPTETPQPTHTPTETPQPTHSATESPEPTPTVLLLTKTAPPAPTPTPVLTLAAGSTNAAWEPITRDYKSIPMVYVPAGCFVMGREDGELDEYPHTVCLSAFWISQTEITNDHYRLCVAEEGCKPPSDASYFNDFSYGVAPVVYVNWWRASEFAEWFGGKLPTEAQWEYAARGPESWGYPWGDVYSSCAQANVETCEDSFALVGEGFRPDGASWVGALDMAGNVWEWVKDRYRSNYYNSLPFYAQDPPGPEDDTILKRVIRGGSWNNPYYYSHAAFRNYLDDPDSQSDYIGFRVVLPAEALDLP